MTSFSMFMITHNIATFSAPKTTYALLPGGQTREWMWTHTHVKTCTYYTATLTSHTPVGDSVHAKHRFRLIEIDHKILDASTATATGCAVILTMLDDVSKLTLFVFISRSENVESNAFKYVKACEDIVGQYHRGKATVFLWRKILR